jgi:predicted GNAT family N-acyltransferase
MNLEKAKPHEIEEIIKVRQEVLHPNGPRDRVVYKQDEEESAYHLVLKNDEGEIIAVGSMFYEMEEGGADSSTFRIRGMAVKESAQGQGIGSQIIEKFIVFAKDQEAKMIWCNARVKALPLYERKGFKRFGETFDVPGSGPHYRLRNDLK